MSDVRPADLQRRVAGASSGSDLAMVHVLTIFTGLLRTVCFALVLAYFADAPVIAQEAITSATPDVVADLRASAAADRAHAADRLRHAKSLHGLAEQAGAAAATASGADRDAWLASMQERREAAAEAEAEATRLEVRAGEKEERASRLEAAHREKFPPPAPTPEPAQAGAEAPAPLHFAIEDVLGVWRPTEGDPYPFVIVQTDPASQAYPYRIEAHTRDRVWSGRYTSFDAGHIARDLKARMVLTYKPKPDEMNPDIPAWARQELAGKLEWRIELDEAGDEVEPRLKAKWYPGKVEWKEGTESGAKIVGDGEAREFELEPEYRLDLEELAQPVLTVTLPKLHDPLLEPLEALIKLQRFFVRVSLPAKLAKEQGPTLIVTIRAMTSRRSTSLTLQASGVTGYRPVTYSHREPITIADLGEEPLREQQIMSLNWLLSNEGARIDLKVADREVVEFRFGEAYERLPIFNSWVQRGLDVHAQAAERVRATANATLEQSPTPGQKRGAERTLRLLDNYQRLLASDRLTDLHRHHLGDIYLGSAIWSTCLVDMTEERTEESMREAIELRAFDRMPEGINPVMQAFLEGISGRDLSSRVHEALEGVAWTSEGEEYFVRNLLATLSARLGPQYVRETVEASTLGLYNGFVTGTAARIGGNLWLVATGNDHFGRRKEKWERLLAAIEIGTEVLQVKGSAGRVFSRRVAHNRLGTRSVSKQNLGFSARGDFRPLGPADTPGDLPGSLGAGQLKQTRLVLEPDVASPGGTHCVPRQPGMPDAVPVRSALEPDQGMVDYVTDQQYVTNVYGSSARFVDPFGDRLFETQGRFQRCQAGATNWAIFRATGKRIGLAEADDMLSNMVIQDVIDGRRPVSDLYEGFGGPNAGYPSDIIRRFARLHGARVAEVTVKTNKGVRLKYIDALLKAGRQVKLVLYFQHIKPNGFHAVIVESIKTNKLGRPTSVTFFDSNVGRLIEMPAADFKKLIPTFIGPKVKGAYGILTTFQFGAD